MTDPSYRLGNITDVWFCNAHVPNSYDTVENLTNGFENTFGHFLRNFKVTDKYCGNFHIFKFFWWMFFSNIKEVLVPFQKSLRNAVSAYFKEIIFDKKTCIIHLRLGDVLLNNHGTFPVNCLIKATDKLPEIPECFEIMNGGKLHLSDHKQLEESNKIIDILKGEISVKFPLSDIIIYESDNADDDFNRMVNAPMLITGGGSFALFAAVANKNFRLTPAIEKLASGYNSFIPTENVTENWFTYSLNN
jgi:hypothetical protein